MSSTRCHTGNQWRRGKIGQVAQVAHADFLHGLQTGRLYHYLTEHGQNGRPFAISGPVLLASSCTGIYRKLNVKNFYQFTTPSKSDEVTHPKQHKSFFSGIM